MLLPLHFFLRILLTISNDSLPTYVPVPYSFVPIERDAIEHVDEESEVTLLLHIAASSGESAQYDGATHVRLRMPDSGPSAAHARLRMQVARELAA